MSGKIIIWGILALSTTGAFIKNISSWDWVDLLFMFLFALGCWAMTIAEAKNSK